MSMTDEGAMPSNQRSANPKPEKPAGRQGTAGQQGGSLPGLAAFGQMQGYTPVGQKPAEAAPAPEPAPEPDTQEVVEDYEDSTGDDGYAEQFAQDFVNEFNQQPETGVEPHAAETGEVEGFSSEEIQNYMSQQYAASEPQDYDAAGNGYEPEAGYPHGDAGPAPYETGGALKTFEAHYDQHPEIPLGAFDEPGGNPGNQPFFQEGEPAHDADFLGGESVAGVAEPKERRGRKALMAASGLVGVLALGGALAFAYKIGGDSDIARTGEPPLIQADSRPVKVAPANPGGKEFPHANKKIYERLGGDSSEEVVKLKSRQEDVAAAATAAIRGTDQPTAQPDAGGPRKVKTLTVRPDGTIEVPDSRQKIVKAPPSDGPVNTSSDGTISMSFPSPASTPPKDEAPKVAAAQPADPQAAPPPVAPTIPQASEKAPQPVAPQQASAGQAPVAAAPTPVQKPAVPKVAAATPAAEPAAPAAEASSGGSYVVQVAARKSQTDALAAFADIQQKYPQLLEGYRPIIKRADLGNKGVWYRLNVGPVESKQVASSLCSQLKSAGMRSCLIRAQ